MSLGHEGVSILWLSEEFDVTRHTVRKRLRDAGIQPSGRSGNGYIYRIADVAPLLCQSCHSQSGHPSIAYTADGLATGIPSQYLLGQSCLNCHEQVHGSNHPSGSKLMR